MTRTKIVATLGPSSSTLESIGALYEAGVDVFRFNFSHGTHADHGARFALVRELEKRHQRPIGIIADLQGPKLRVGTFADGRVQLDNKASFRLDLDPTPGDAKRVTLPHPEIFRALKPGSILLLDDGKMRLRVVECGSDHAETEVLVGGWLSNHKGVNLPNVRLGISPITEKDRADLAFALDLGINMVALSFVQTPEDLIEARELIGDRAMLIVKLEKPSAVRHLERIVSLTDAVMVARGDLGVELPPEDVPVLQRRIVHACRRMAKPVIVATQMLESMIQSPIPTRAEASDIATAVYEGADAVMLSGETAAGAYPVEAVAMMARVITRSEQDSSFQQVLRASELVREATSANAVTSGARVMAETVGAAVIAAFTMSGETVLRAARERPPVQILGLTPTEQVARKLTLVWGVHPVTCQNMDSFRALMAEASRRAHTEGFAQAGSTIVVIGGFPAGTSANTVHIRTLDDGSAAAAAP
ncbi:MAG: pyruvate kinase [Rhodospirillales bacterium]